MLSGGWLELRSGTLLGGERVPHPKEPGLPRPGEPPCVAGAGSPLRGPKLQRSSRVLSWMLPPGSQQVVREAALFSGIPSIPTGGSQRQQQAEPRKEGDLSWSRAPEAAASWGVSLLQPWGLPSFSVAKLSDLDVATSGLCVAPVRAQLALMNCCSLFPPLF